jgi:hypothetical protein
MADERLSDILRIYEAALGHEGTERAAYLDVECGQDPALRQEVEALLAAPSGDAYLPVSTPPWARPPIVSGQHLGPYEILSAIGAGGRGSALELAERSPAKANSYENAPVARFPRRSEVK